MVYTDFMITTIDTDTINKTIIINGSFDFDPESVTDKHILLLDKKTRNIAEYTLKTSGKTITLVLAQWPTPNQEYILSVENLKSVIGDKLQTGIRRRVFFNSKILSTINITKPADGEYMHNVEIEWEEILPDPTYKKEEFIYDYIKSYYIEIAKDPAFYKIAKTTVVENRTKIELNSLEAGQYYIRCRAQKNNEYGKWSETKSFIASDSDKPPSEIVIPDEDYMPIIEDELRVITFPDDNETPESIIIEFDGKIDPESIKDLIVMRRPI